MSAPVKSALAEAIELVRARLSSERMGGRVVRGTIPTIVVSAAGAGISMVVQMGLSNALGKESFGTYLLVMGWLSIGQLVGKLELDLTGVRFVGRYIATEQWSLLRGFLRAGSAALIATSIALAVLAAIGIEMFRVPLQAKHPSLPDALLIACIALPVTNLLLFEGALLQGLQRYAESQFPVSLLRPLGFGLILLFIALILGKTLTTPIAVLGNLLSSAVALGLAWRWRKRAVPPQTRIVEPSYDRATWVTTSYPLFAVSLGQVIISQQADVIVVATMLTTAQAGVYGAASQLTMPVVLAAASVTYVAQSMIADLYSRDPGRLQSLVRAVTWLSAGVSIPIALVLIGLGPFLLSLYGEGMAEGHSVLIILTLAQLVIGIVGALAGYLMTMTAHEREAAWIIGLTAVANLVLAIVLTPRFGPVGTASATLVASIARVAFLSHYIRRAMGIKLLAF